MFLRRKQHQYDQNWLSYQQQTNLHHLCNSCSVCCPPVVDTCTNSNWRSLHINQNLNVKAGYQSTISQSNCSVNSAVIKRTPSDPDISSTLVHSSPFPHHLTVPPPRSSSPHPVTTHHLQHGRRATQERMSRPSPELRVSPCYTNKHQRSPVCVLA